jgi:hypothetical protein
LSQPRLQPHLEASRRRTNCRTSDDSPAEQQGAATSA